MEGPPEDRGVNFRALAELFSLARSSDAADAKAESSLPANGGFVFTVSMLEVYNEEIRDLLRADSVDAAELVPTLEVRQRKKGGVYVENLTRVEVAEPDEVEKLMAIGARNRSTHSNNINEHSSRSHLVLSVQISRGSPADDGDGVGELNLIDLAGSERLAKTGAT